MRILTSKFLYEKLLVNPPKNFGQGLPRNVLSSAVILPSGTPSGPLTSLYFTSPTQMLFSAIGRSTPLLSTGRALFSNSSLLSKSPSSLYPKKSHGAFPTCERCAKFARNQSGPSLVMWFEPVVSAVILVLKPDILKLEVHLKPLLFMFTVLRENPHPLFSSVPTLTMGAPTEASPRVPM